MTRGTSRDPTSDRLQLRSGRYSEQVPAEAPEHHTARLVQTDRSDLARADVESEQIDGQGCATRAVEDVPKRTAAAPTATSGRGYGGCAGKGQLFAPRFSDSRSRH